MLKDKIMEAIGEASMCWAATPDSEFDSEAAARIGEKLYEELMLDLVPTETSFQRELTDLINRHSLEGFSNTPDFLLARYLVGCINVYNVTINAREHYGNADST